MHVLGLVGEVLGREVERALGQQAGEVVDAAAATPWPVRAEIGKTSASAARARPRPAAPRTVRGVVEPVDLVDRDHDRDRRAARAPRR